MKYCSHCGKEIDDNVKFCPYCGQPVNGGFNGVGRNQSYEYSSSSSSGSALVLVAFILGILSTIARGWLLIPLAWCIPRLIKVNDARTNGARLSVGFCVCFLLFVNLIGGILLLCSDSVEQ